MTPKKAAVRFIQRPVIQLNHALARECFVAHMEGAVDSRVRIGVDIRGAVEIDVRERVEEIVVRAADRPITIIAGDRRTIV